jgi:cytochrome c556
MNMKATARKFGFGIVAIVVAAGVSAGVSAQAQDKMMAMKDRVALMKENGKNLGPIGKTVKGEMAADYAALAANAAAIRDNAMKLKDMFPEGSGGGESRALPAIWENKADFNASLVKLASAADAFAKEAATGSMADLKASFGAIAGNCAGCHKSYRAEKNG